MADGGAAAAPPKQEAFVMVPNEDVKKAVRAGRIDAAPGQAHAAELECAICSYPAFLFPVKTSPKECGHLFHRDCLCRWLKNKEGPARTCPTCRTVLPPGPAAYTRPDRQILAVLAAMQVECPQDCEQPRKRVRYDELADHINECAKTPCRCNQGRCMETLPRHEMEAQHIDNCPWALVPCEQCNLKVRRRGLRSHHEKHCDMRRYTCPGCKQKDLVWGSRQSHELKCTGGARLCDVAELRKEVRTLLEEKQRYIEGLGVLLGKPQEERLRLLPRHLLATALGVPMQVEMHSIEYPGAAGRYTLLPTCHEGGAAYANEEGWRLFKMGGPWWGLSRTPEEMMAPKGKYVVVMANQLPNQLSPVSDCGWCRHGAELAGTSVSAVSL
eukprot:TRINITY_DN61430_c0_g1_i1.p2 TRINITY_DN61430_c0_g1~~TRINITY_DN61430_c0_g1_i1.p2  ORF type:complete len:384 (+),score=89.53 TRINITY_DN61430_c0_g1_i1:86-1237(+)